MPTINDNATDRSIESDLSTGTICELIANDRRRLALHYLTRSVGSAPVSDLADQLALWEGEHTRDRYERICTSLVHTHVPKLVDAGVARYDPDRETVELLEAADRLAPYLDLAAPGDIR